MRFTRCFVVIVCLMPGVGTLVRAQEVAKPAPATRPAEETISAWCVVRIRWDHERVSFPHLESLITSQRATREAAQKLLGVAKPVRPLIEQLRHDPGEIDVRIQVVLAGVPGAKLAAAEYMDALTANLGTQLEEYQQNAVSSEVRPVRERADRAERNLEQLRAILADRRNRLRDATGRVDVQNWREAIAGLEQEREKLSLDLAGQQARRKAIEKTIATITKQAEGRAKDDPVAVEFEKIVQVRERELGLVREMVATGRASQVEAADLEAKVADAKSKLLERRELATRGAGGELMGELNRELMMLAINGAEHEARAELILARLNQFHESAADVDRIKQLDRDLATAEAEWREARKQATSLEDRYRELQAPGVTVLECLHITPAQWQRDPGRLFGGQR
jgi:hypothetical protein